MAEKKRKVTDIVSDPGQATKKAKKSKKGEVTTTDTVVAGIAIPIKFPESEAPSKTAKKPRKRAADFLDDEPDVAAPKKGKKSKGVTLTADGSNGVEENSDDGGVTITTTKKPKAKSMMAEAANTQDDELEQDWGKGDDDQAEDVDTAPALLTGFDSDNDDPAEDKDFDSSRVQPIPQFKKTSKKLRKAKEHKSDGPGAVYVGRVPHGFYEAQMREYFSQFGDIKRLRLSRNKRTGASKHFAFIEFESDEVAKIVAETMDNYLMFGHILKCKYAPEGTLHPDVWKGANRKYRKIPQHKLLKAQNEKPKTEEQMLKKMSKVQRKRQQQAEKLKSIGYELELPELKKPNLNGIEDADQTLKGIEDKVEGAVIPPATVPKDEVASKVEDQIKKQRKTKKTKAGEIAPVAEPALDSKKSKSRSEIEEPTTTTDVLQEQQAKVKKAKKDKVTIEATTVKPEPVKKDKKKDRQLKGILKKPTQA